MMVFVPDGTVMATGGYFDTIVGVLFDCRLIGWAVVACPGLSDVACKGLADVACRSLPADQMGRCGIPRFAD